MMDDVAYKLKMDPVDFALKNMTRKANDQIEYTNYTLGRSASAAARRRSSGRSAGVPSRARIPAR